MSQFEDITAAVLALPEDERAELVEAALESLIGPAPLSDAWKAELDRREAELDAGTTRLVPDDELFARLRSRYA